MAVLTQDDLLEAIDKMTVLELSEFIKRFEERYGVTAAAPVAVAAATPRKLPKTASPLPLLGLLALVSGGIALSLRAARARLN